MADARDVLDSGKTNTKTTTKKPTEAVSGEVNTLLIKSITNIEEKVEAIDWKLWEIYNIIKDYAENPSVSPSTSVSQPQASPADVAIEVAKLLGGAGGGEEKKSVVKKLFG